MCDCVFCFFFSSRRRHTRCALVTGVQTCALPIYHFRQPQQALFDSPRGFLDLALTHRPGEARGSYVSAPGFSACPLGDIIFIPAHQGLRSQWGAGVQSRSEEHTSELQSLMRTSYAVFCLTKKKTEQAIYRHLNNNKQ